MSEVSEPSTPASPLADDDAWHRRFTPAWSTLALVVGVALAIASISIDPPADDELVSVAGTEESVGQGNDAPLEPGDVVAAPEGGDGDSGTGSTSAGPTGKRTSTAGAGNRTGPAANTQTVVTTPRNIQCKAGDNGGKTSEGVSGSGIKLGATVVQSGIGASFLGDVRFAMQAVVNKTNRSGGICGRQISLKLVDDGWSFQMGGDYLRNLVEGEKVFALAVVPSSEGLKNVSDAGYLAQHGIPAVGTDGMLIGQYTDPFIWPVAASTVSTMHIMAKQAKDAGADTFGLVYESTYHFGIEGAYAFNAAVKRLTGSDIPGYSNPLTKPRCDQRFCAVNADSDSYSTEIQKFNQACEPCDFVGMLLEPTTATKWMKGGGIRAVPGSRRLGGVQPLFTSDFGNACGLACHDMWLWTGYTPPLGDFLSRPAVSTYVNDVKAASSSADYTNSFVEGGYIGMTLVVEALKKVGPNLTRENLRAALDSMTLDTGGLAPPLSWTPGNHFANTRMQAYSIQYKGGFNGWRDEQVSYEDPWVADIPAYPFAKRG